jgi:hypothetical protein
MYQYVRVVLGGVCVVLHLSAIPAEAVTFGLPFVCPCVSFICADLRPRAQFEVAISPLTVSVFVLASFLLSHAFCFSRVLGS